MRTLLSCIGVLALVGLAGCTAAPKGGNVTGGGGAQATGGSGGGGGVGKGGDGGDLFGTGGIGVGGGTSNDCVAGQDEDHDADGVSIAQGDCNDCDVNVNPGAVEVMTNTGGGGSGGGGPGVPTDEDCDGLIDEMDPDLTPATRASRSTAARRTAPRRLIFARWPVDRASGVSSSPSGCWRTARPPRGTRTSIPGTAFSPPLAPTPMFRRASGCWQSRAAPPASPSTRGTSLSAASARATVARTPRASPRSRRPAVSP